MQRSQYGQPLSTVFGDQTEKHTIDYDEDDDPVLPILRLLEYRYIRFWFHPVRDRFILGNAWKDPSWTDVRSLRTGLDGDEKVYRLVVFGPNLVNVERKSIPQLLADEVGEPTIDPVKDTTDPS